MLYDELVIRRGLRDFVRSGLRPVGANRAILDGRPYACVRGAWAIWIPALQTKFLNSIDGKLACLSRKAPPREGVSGSGRLSSSWGNYSLEAWRRAYETPVSRRVAENVVAAARLHAAGLGRQVLGRRSWACVWHGDFATVPVPTVGSRPGSWLRMQP